MTVRTHDESYATRADVSSATGTYAESGCPLTCTSFVQNYPNAFAEAYWSINSLRVYTASGKPAASTPINKGLVAGVVAGGVVVIALIAALVWRYKKRVAARYALHSDLIYSGIKRIQALTSRRKAQEDNELLTREDNQQPKFGWVGGVSASGTDSSKSDSDTDLPAVVPYALPSTGASAPIELEPEIVAPNKKEKRDMHGNKIMNQQKDGKIISVLVDRKAGSAVGKTQLGAGRTARHHLEGETRLGAYHEQAAEGHRQAVDAGARKIGNVQNSWVG